MRKFLYTLIFPFVLTINANAQVIDPEILPGHWKLKSFSFGNIEKDFNVAQRVFLKLTLRQILKDSYLIFKKDGTCTFNFPDMVGDGAWSYSIATESLTVIENDKDETAFTVVPLSKTKLNLKIDVSTEDEEDAIVIKIKKKRFAFL